MKPRNSTAPSAICSRETRTLGRQANKSAVNATHPHNNSSHRSLLGVMEDHADRMPPAGTKPADAVAHIDTIGAARPPHRADMHSKGDAVTLAKRHDLGARLHARALFGQHELAAFE